MDLKLLNLPFEELTALQLRKFYEENGYSLFKMSSFEEYDFYMQNKAFLAGNDIITFTAQDGRLMALKPDVTLSIIKNTPNAQTRRLYYNESVYRRSPRTNEYKEVKQTGVEYVGGEGKAAEAEILILAAKSLAMAGPCSLAISSMEFVEAILALFNENEQQRQTAFDALQSKSPHSMRQAAKEANITEQLIKKLEKLVTLSGDFKEVAKEAKELSKDINGAEDALNELCALYELIKKENKISNICLDFSVVNDLCYYNGLIFKGYVQGLPYPVLTGGRYDKLLRRFNKTQGALGFAINLDEIGRLKQHTEQEKQQEEQKQNEYLNIALPKGRLGKKVYEIFEKAGLSCNGILDESRKLVFEDDETKTRYFLVKPGDVDIYVEHGAADIGVVGKDVMLESGADVLELFDLGLGKCRLAVAAVNGFKENTTQPLKVATKYPVCARRYYAAKSREVDIIELHGSIELAPLLGLSDVIVDIVETGSTLKENNLGVIADVASSSARLIANRSAWRFKGDRIQNLVEKLGEVT